MRHYRGRRGVGCCRVLADINADNGNRTIEILRHGVLLVFGAPCQHRSLAGQEHGRPDHPITGNKNLRTTAVV